MNINTIFRTRLSNSVDESHQMGKPSLNTGKAELGGELPKAELGVEVPVSGIGGEVPKAELRC